jgi:hypothetical protein
MNRTTGHPGLKRKGEKKMTGNGDEGKLGWAMLPKGRA